MKKFIFTGICCFLLFAAGCTNKEELDQQKELWAGGKNLYSMSMGYLGENESDERMEDVCARFTYLFQLLEENKNGFIMDADNYRGIDDAGTPAYTKGDFYIYPEEISPEGRCIRVSKNYFKYNAVDDWEGNPVEMKLVMDERAKNLIVPEKYSSMEQDILKAYEEENMDLHIIYAADNQKYFTFSRFYAESTGNQIEDPIAIVYSENIQQHMIYNFIKDNQIYFYSDCGSDEAVLEDIEDILTESGLKEACQYVLPVYEPEIWNR